MNSIKLNALGLAYAQAWCSQQPDAVAAHFSEHGSLSVNDSDPAVGRAAIAAVARGFMTVFPDMVVKMDTITPRSQSTIFRWTLTGTSTGPGGSGRSVRISGYEEWQLDRDGSIAKSKGHFDAADYARQLGQPLEA